MAISVFMVCLILFSKNGFSEPLYIGGFLHLSKNKVAPVRHSMDSSFS